MEAVTPTYQGGAGSRMVLLHGVNMSWRIWRPVLPLLECEHTIYAPTLPGHRGGAPMPAGSRLNVPALADALERQLDAAGIGRAHLVGNSLGGWLALELAMRGRARSVVALSPAGGWRNRRDLLRLTTLMRLSSRVSRSPLGALLTASTWLRQVLLRPACERGDRISVAEVRGMLRDVRACTVLDGLLDAVRADGPIDRPPVAPACPIRIAWSARDRTIPFYRYGKPLMRVFPRAEFVALPGVGHVPMYDNPGLVASAVLEHTRRTETVLSTVEEA